MNGYQIAIIVLMILSIGINLGKDGEPRKGNYSFWNSVLSEGILLFLLIKGGFFS